MRAALERKIFIFFVIFIVEEYREKRITKRKYRCYVSRERYSMYSNRNSLVVRTVYSASYAE